MLYMHRSFVRILHTLWKLPFRYLFGSVSVDLAHTPLFSGYTSTTQTTRERPHYYRVLQLLVYVHPQEIVDQTVCRLHDRLHSHDNMSPHAFTPAAVPFTVATLGILSYFLSLVVCSLPLLLRAAVTRRWG